MRASANCKVVLGKVLKTYLEVLDGHAGYTAAASLDRAAHLLSETGPEFSFTVAHGPVY